MRTLRRRAALALAGLFLTALLSAEAHRATALHALCAKHGQVIHLHGVASGAPAPTPLVRGAGEATDSVEHGCTQLDFLAHSVAAPGCRVAITPQPYDLDQRVFTPDAPVRGVSLVRLSPSRSPPRA